MKQSRFMKVIALILVLSLSFSAIGVSANASSMYPITESDDPIGVIFADIIDTLLRFITDMLARLFGDGPTFIPEDDETLDAKIAANYYEGTGKNFATQADDTAQWQLGYSSTSLIPKDYDNGSYYIGGYISLENGFTNVVEGIAEIPGIGKDDMKARCVSISDGADRDGDGQPDGTVLFATIDCIGITNADIKDIRDLLADYAAANNIVAINISSTHAHSCIDTEGLWTKNLAKLAFNGLNAGFGTDEELMQGTNPEYMEFLKEKVADALIAAHVDMKPGKLTYAMKEINEEYFQNKNRPSAGELVDFDENGNIITNGNKVVAMTEIHRFVFTPDDETATPTMMINMAAHPDVAGLPTESNSGREISGDYVFYLGKHLEDAGYNFMFFQGAIAAIYMSRGVTGDNVETQQRVEESQRYGFEIARVALSLTKTEEEIIADPTINTNADEIAENTELISIYDEDGNLIPEFSQFGFTYASIDETNLTTPAGNVNIKNVFAPFSVSYDSAANTVAIMSGSNVVEKFTYSSENFIADIPNLGLIAVTDSNGNPLDVYVYNAELPQNVSEDGTAFVVGTDEAAFPIAITTAPTYSSTSYCVSEDGKAYANDMIPVNPAYSVWYENWTPVDEVEVEPYLNLYIKQVEITITNTLIEAIGKLNMANYVVIANDDGTYTTVTEVGYMEMGSAYKAVFLPGEICQDLVAPNGKSLYASNAVTCRDFLAPTACKLFGDDIACMGLMNDAIGYVVPDNDYTMGDPANHYHELISLGKTVGSELMYGLEDLKNELVYY